MFGIGGFELFIIVLFAFIIFGPDKLPQATKIAGKGIKKFRKAKAEMDAVLQEEVIDPVMAEANKPDAPKAPTKSEDKSKQAIPDNADAKLEELKKDDDKASLEELKKGDDKASKHNVAEVESSEAKHEDAKPEALNKDDEQGVGKKENACSKEEK